MGRSHDFRQVGANFRGPRSTPPKNEKNHRIWPTIFKGLFKVYTFEKKIRISKGLKFSGDPRWLLKNKKLTGFDPLFLEGPNLQNKNILNRKNPVPFRGRGGGMAPKPLGYASE